MVQEPWEAIQAPAITADPQPITIDLRTSMQRRCSAAITGNSRSVCEMLSFRSLAVGSSRCPDHCITCECALPISAMGLDVIPPSSGYRSTADRRTSSITDRPILLVVR